MEQKKVRGFGFRGWMLILYQAIAFLTFQVFTQYPLNILADFYGGAQKVSGIYSACAVAGIFVQILHKRFLRTKPKSKQRTAAASCGSPFIYDLSGICFRGACRNLIASLPCSARMGYFPMFA